MLDPYTDAVFRVIESQGVIAGLLILQMWKNRGERRELLAKVCELNRFIMRCLERELDEEHNRSNGSVVAPDRSSRYFSGPAVGLLPKRVSALKRPLERS